MNEETMKLETREWTNEDQQFLIKLLHRGELTIEFTKVNGDFRSMNCTLDQNLIPEDKQPKDDAGKSEKKMSDQALRVFDTNKQEWRSFRWSNLTKIILF
jgi:hypothetical protein